MSEAGILAERLERYVGMYSKPGFASAVADSIQKLYDQQAEIARLEAEVAELKKQLGGWRILANIAAGVPQEPEEK